MVTGVGEDIDPRIDALISINDGPFVHVATFDGNDIDDGASFGGAPKQLSERVFTTSDRVIVRFSGYEDDTTGDDWFAAVETIVTIDTPGPDGEEEVTLNMHEIEGDNHVRFVVTVREITTP